MFLSELKKICNHSEEKKRFNELVIEANFKNEKIPAHVLYKKFLKAGVKRKLNEPTNTNSKKKKKQSNSIKKKK